MLATLLRSAVNRGKEHLHLRWNGKFVFAVVTSTPTCFLLPLRGLANQESEQTLSTNDHCCCRRRALLFCTHFVPSFLPIPPSQWDKHSAFVSVTHTHAYQHMPTRITRTQRNAKQTQTHCAYLLSLKITKWGEERKKGRVRARLSESRRNKQEPS